MPFNELAALEPLLAAALTGGVIGLERSYNGRPAGFRTHTLVCMASSLLMLLTVHQLALLPELTAEVVRVDPTRMAQGIMTGIGFLGAGVIVKERLTVRGLTTAASLWMTAAIGIIIGIGYYSAAIAATILTVGTLSFFRLIEPHLPGLYYGRMQVRMNTKKAMDEDCLRDIARSHHFKVSQPTYHLLSGGKIYEYHVTIRTRDKRNFRALAETLKEHALIAEFDLVRVGE